MLKKGKPLPKYLSANKIRSLEKNLRTCSFSVFQISSISGSDGISLAFLKELA